MSDLPLSVRPFLAASQARMRVSRRLFEYWQGVLRDGAPPQRTEIDPSAIKDILPFVLLGDIEPDPFRVLFRLIGTGVAEFSRQDFCGRYLDELVYDARDSVEWRICYEYIHGRHVGVVGDNVISYTDGRAATYEFAILPLARGHDPVGSFIAVEAYEGLDRMDIPDLTPVTRGA
jgi:hypothetical protein